MRSCHSLQAIFLNELVGYVLPKCVPGAARGDTPPCAIVRVRPEQVAHGTLVRHLDHAVDIANHVQCVQTGRKAAVQAEDLVLDDGGQWQVIEQICEVLPHVCVAVLAEAFVIEAVDLGDLATLVIAPKNGDPVLEAHFQANQQCDCLYTIVASVDVVSHEQVVCVGRASSYLKELHQVVELPVDVATDGHRALDRLHVDLALQDFFRLYHAQR